MSRVQVGLPPGVLNLVFGYGPTCGEALVLHPKVSMGSSGFGIHFIGKETRIEALLPVYSMAAALLFFIRARVPAGDSKVTVKIVFDL